MTDRYEPPAITLTGPPPKTGAWFVLCPKCGHPNLELGPEVRPKCGDQYCRADIPTEATRYREQGLPQ